jgi:hypothetical protein
MTTWLHGERGSVAVTTVVQLVLLLTVGAAALIGVADLAVASGRARIAADAAALSAAGTSPLVAVTRPERPEDAARRTAVANHARLRSTNLTGWPLRVSVEVEVQPATAWVRHAAGPVTATATAGVRPRDG